MTAMEKLNEFLATKIPKSIYFGRKCGCLCGCNGKYFDYSTRTLNRFKKLVNTYLPNEIEITDSYFYFKYTNEFGNAKEACIYKD